MSQIPWLDQDQLVFPALDQALTSPNGLLAAGGDLCPERLILAYRRGIFPWYEEGQPILWWSPSPRTVIFPDKLHVSRSLRKTLRRGKFTVTADTAFETVISACADTRFNRCPGGEGTWITRDMYRAYCRLHQLGYAHSVEAWSDGELAGGLYGIAMGRVFFGESMFSAVRDASKVAFVHLVEQVAAWGFSMIDCQVASDHLFSLGAQEITRQQFSQLLVDYIDSEPDFNCSAPHSSAAQRRWQMTWRYDND